MKETQVQVRIITKDGEAELSSDITLHFDSVLKAKNWLETIESLINNL